MRQLLLQNATAILIQNVTKVYYKMRQFFLLYNKMRIILSRFVIVITKCVDFITKFDTNWHAYYKMRQCNY